MHLMIDIETLSTHKDAAVLSIGMAWFDGNAIIDTCHIAIKPAYIDGHIDARTVAWWAGQGSEAREAAFGGDVSQSQAKLNFRDFVKLHEADEVWANSPSFDLVILNSWWYRGDRPCEWPLHFRTERDCRTMFALGRELNIEFGHVWDLSSTAHNALDDACNQARAVIAIRRGMHEHMSIYNGSVLR